MTSNAPPTPWAAPHARVPVVGRVVVPGSKSATARAYLLAAIADAPTTLRGVLSARDTHLMRSGLEALGVHFSDVGEGVVRVSPPEAFTPGAIDAGLAGTVMRFLPPLAALAEGHSTFSGDAAMAKRPIGPLLDALGRAGVQIEYDGSLPFHIYGAGRVPGGPVEVDASASSQFVSGLLLAAPRFDAGIDLKHVGPPIPSRPHIDMTVAMLRQRGVVVVEGADSWKVSPGPVAALDMDVEPDLTNTAAFLAAGMVTAGAVSASWPEHSLQASDRILDVLEQLGARVRRAPGEVTVGADLLVGADVDLSDVSELTPVVAALAAVALGPSRIRGVGHIRGHETDRLAALEAELASLGCRVSQTDDGLLIDPAPMVGRTFATYGDHRLAHTGAILGLVVPGVELDDVSCTMKTISDFPRLWQELVAR